MSAKATASVGTDRFVADALDIDLIRSIVMRLFDLRQIHVVVTLERRGAVVIGLVVGCVSDRNDSGVRALEGKAVLRGEVELDFVYRLFFAVFTLGRTGILDLYDALLSVGKLSERGGLPFRGRPLCGSGRRCLHASRG